MSRITFVGTSDAFGSGGRRQAAIFVETPAGDGLLLDCAPTTGTGLAQLGIPRLAIDVVAVSHFHADHFAGIPQLVLASVYEDRRRKPLLVAGPVGVEHRVRAAAEAIGHRLDPAALPFALDFVELPAGAERDLGIARVESFATHHQPESSPHGLLVRAGARRIAYTGDTGWFDGLPARVTGCDVCISECTFHASSFEYHLDYRRLEAEAASFACGRLVLTHLGPEMSERRGRLALETADDGLVIEL